MDSLLSKELESGVGSLTGAYSPEEREEIEQKFEEMHGLMAWMKEKRCFIPPWFVVTFNALACEVLELSGHKITVDPGVLPD